MSQIPDSAFDQPAEPAKGMSISALVCAIVGNCLPGVGLVGLVLGIVALVRSNAEPRRYGGRGMAIAAIIVGGVSLVVSVVLLLMVGILLPALGKAGNSARNMVTLSNARMVGVGLSQYAMDNKGWLPEAGADLPSRLSKYGLTPKMFESLSVDSRWKGAADTFVYVPGFRTEDIHSPSQAVVFYENPKYHSRGLLVVVYADGHTTNVTYDQIQSVLNASEKPAAPKDR